MKKAEAFAAILNCLEGSEGLLVRCEFSDHTLVLTDSDFQIVYAIQWVWNGSYGRFGGYLGFIPDSIQEAGLSIQELLNERSEQIHWIDIANAQDILSYATVTDIESVELFSRFVIDKMKSLFVSSDPIRAILNDDTPTPNRRLKIIKILNDKQSTLAG